MVQLFIKHPSFKIPLCIKIDPQITINDLKNKIGCTTLYYRTLLEDTYTVEHYQIENNATIYGSGVLMGGLPVVDAGTSAMVAFLAPFVALKTTVTNLKYAELLKDNNLNWFQRIVEFAKKTAEYAQMIFTVIKFFPIITVFLIFLAFLGRPVEFIVLIFGLFLMIALYIIYSVLNLPPFIYVVAAVWFAIFDIIPLLIYCAVFTALFILVFIVCIILTALNTITGGALKDIVLCDNPPNAWYKTANYHLDNKWERGIFCTRPCFGRYKPDPTGINCKKLPKGYPPYCPQAEIMRIYTRKKADRKYKFNNFDDKSNVKYMSKNPLEKENALKKHYLTKRSFMDSCDKKMSDFNSIALNICSSADSFEATKHLQPKEILKLKQVCAQGFCGANKNYPWCSKMSGLKEDDNNAIIKKVIKITIIAIVFALVFLFTMEYMYKNNQQ